jgi:hypothetical protein
VYSLYGYGIEEAAVQGDEGLRGYAADFEEVRVALGGPAQDGYRGSWRCGDCGHDFDEPVTVHYDEEKSIEDTEVCPDCESEDITEDSGTHTWLNSAAITIDPESVNGVTVSISVGDPRGAWSFTVRKLDDGSMIMHTPYPGEGMPHEALVELHPGTYQRVGYDPNHKPAARLSAKEAGQIIGALANEGFFTPEHDSTLDKLNQMKADAERSAKVAAS